MERADGADASYLDVERAAGTEDTSYLEVARDAGDDYLAIKRGEEAFTNVSRCNPLFQGGTSRTCIADSRNRSHGHQSSKMPWHIFCYPFISRTTQDDC